MPSHLAPRPLRLAYLVTHPIQYQAPLLRRIAESPDIDLHVFFQSAVSVNTYHDRGFGQAVHWDVPLLDGYQHTFLPLFFGKPDAITASLPLSRGLTKHLRDGQFDAIWIHGYSRPYGLFIGIISRLLGLMVLIRDDVHRIGNRRRPIHEIGKRAILSFTSAIGFHFLAIGTANQRFYEEMGVAKRNITLMPYAVDNEWFAAKIEEAEKDTPRPRTALGIEDGAPVILYAGKFQPWKRPMDLLHAYKQATQKLSESGHDLPWLIYAGSGEELDAVQAAARDMPRVKFLGFQNQKQLARLFTACDVFVLPSDKEPWGLIVNEVMNAGKAIVVTDQCGCAEDLVIPGRNGFIYPAGDTAALSEHLTLLCSDRTLCSKMGRESLDIIRTWDFSSDLIALRRALTKICKGRSSLFDGVTHG